MRQSANDSQRHLVDASAVDFGIWVIETPRDTCKPFLITFSPAAFSNLPSTRRRHSSHLLPLLRHLCPVPSSTEPP